LYLTIRAADQRRAKKSSIPKNPRSDPTALGDDGMLADIEVQPLRDVSDKKDLTSDVKQFFGVPYLAKGKRGSRAERDDGMLADIEVQPLRDVSDKKDLTADVKQFFGVPYLAKGKRGPELKLHRKCKICG
jgi:succinate dehydrogenase/fumarate reductase-like Fe-S protein